MRFSFVLSVVLPVLGAVAGCDVRAPIGVEMRVTAIAPANGAGFGRAGGPHPALRWHSNAPGLPVYHVQMDDSCMGPADCTFPSPEIDDPAVTGASYVPSIELPYPTTAPVGRRYYWRVRACADSVCGAWSQVRYVVAGRTAGALNTDYNGDGYSDLVVAAPESSKVAQQAGQVSLYLGGPTLSSVPSLVLDSDKTLDEFGATVAMVGDVNGDGFGDFLVRSNGDEGTQGRAPTPQVSIYFGGTNALTPPARLTAGIVDDENMAAAGIGDVNGDGYDDFAFGAVDAGTDHVAILPARVEVHFGGPTLQDAADLTLLGTTDADFFGSAVAGGGDVNGDGYPDFVVGSHQNGNLVRVYYGGPGMGDVAGTTLAPPSQQGDLYGFSVAIVPDMNNDGFDEVVVGAPGSDGHPSPLGRAYVYFGGQPMDTIPDLTFSGSVEAEWFATTVASAGDVNGDGFGDLAVVTRGVQTSIPSGVPGRTATNGRVDVFYGGPSMDTTPDVTVGAGPADPGPRGFAATDLDGDARPDLVVGRWVTDSNGMGEVAIFPSTADYATPSVILSGSAPRDYFGAKIAR